VKVVHLSTYDLFGGAARAAFRLHAGLRAAGLDSTMLVRQRKSDRADVSIARSPFGTGWRKLQRRLDRIPLAIKPPVAAAFSIGWVPDGLAPSINALAPDIVHVHWTADGFMRPETVAKFNAPIVWTMHDMWAFTGGCHYTGGCERFRNTCGCCPLLGGNDESDWSRRGWTRRSKAYRGRGIWFVAPSRWLATQARASALLGSANIEVIPNGFDIDRFSPSDANQARTVFGLRPDAFVVMAGAAQFSANARKGFHQLVAALDILRGTVPAAAVQIALFGSEAPVPAELSGFAVRDLGPIASEETLAQAYAAADVFVAPSLADNLPNTVIEAMAVGVPVVAYDVGGMSDIVDHNINGLLLPAADTAALARGLAEMMANPKRRIEWGLRARDKALRVFAIGRAVQAYQNIYRKAAEKA
jgi:glycosyltransferase involved in cell wall biosynthesis